MRVFNACVFVPGDQNQYRDVPILFIMYALYSHTHTHTHINHCYLLYNIYTYIVLHSYALAIHLRG